MLDSRENQNQSHLVANSAEPIFLLGFARSGTTWMAKALRDYLGVGMVNEGTFVTELGKLYPAGKPLPDPNRLVKEIERNEFSLILDRAYGISIDWQKILREQADGRYADYVQAALADIADKLDCQFIGSKSPAFGRQTDVLLRHFPQCSVIHLVRDGRDCALSHYQQDWGRKNAYVVAQMWREYIGRVRNELAASPACYLEVRYEDLLREPRRYFQCVADFVFACDKHNSGLGTASDAAERFAARIKPNAFDKRAFKWKSDMTARDIEIFDSTAGSALLELGYEAKEHVRPLPGWRRAYYWFEDRLQRELTHKKKKLRLNNSLANKR